MSWVAVTGATGYLGSALVARLRAAGHRVLALSRRPDVARDLLGEDEGLEIENMDFTLTSWAEELRRSSALAGCTTVFHLAADLAYFGSNNQLQVNVRATDTLARLCIHHGVSRMVFASSIEATGIAPAGPARSEDQRGVLSPYGLSKALAEERLAVYGQSIPVGVARIGIVFGPNDRWTTGLGEAFRDGEQLQDLIALGENQLSLVHRDDAAEGMLRLADAGEASGCYHLAVTPVRLRDALAEVAAAMDTTLPAAREPAARRTQLAERVWQAYREQRADLQTYLAWPHPACASRGVSSERLRSAVGWAPTRSFTRSEIGVLPGR